MPMWICMYRQLLLRERQLLAYLHYICVRPLHVCSFYYDGQCEGPNKQERATSKAFTHFFTINQAIMNANGNIIIT